MAKLKNLFGKKFYYADVGDENTIQLVFDNAINLSSQNQENPSEVLIVTDCIEIMKYEIFRNEKYRFLSNKLHDGVNFQGVQFKCCNSENIPSSFHGSIIAFFSDYDSLREICYSNANNVIFVPGSKNVLYEFINTLGAEKLQTVNRGDISCSAIKF